MVDEDPLVDEVPVKRNTGSSQKKKKARREADFWGFLVHLVRSAMHFPTVKSLKTVFKISKFSRELQAR